MPVGKIGSVKNNLDGSWQTLPAEPATELQRDRYVPGTNWKGLSDVGSVITARWWRPFDSQKISFRLLGQKYEWTIYPRTFQVLDQNKKLVGTVYIEDMFLRKAGEFRIFDVTLTGHNKGEIFGYIARDGSVPFVCRTRHTPRAEKIKIVRIMEDFVSGRVRATEPWGCRDGLSQCGPPRDRDGRYLDMVLRRLDDADMLNSFVEQLVPYLDKDGKRREWAAASLISAMESSVMRNRKRVRIAKRLLPMIGHVDSVSNRFAEAMSRGSSRNFLATMKRLLLPKLRAGDIGRRVAVAYILLSIEQYKQVKGRFFRDISDILSAVQPVLRRARGADVRMIADVLEHCGIKSVPLPVLATYVDSAATLFASSDEDFISNASEIIYNIVIRCVK